MVMRKNCEYLQLEVPEKAVPNGKDYGLTAGELN
jgi:hypothetical protein